MAVDGDASTFWASRFDEVSPVTITIDTGLAQHVDRADVSWAYVPKSFAFAISEGGNEFVTVFRTDSNNLNSTVINLAGRKVQKARIVMSQATT